MTSRSNNAGRQARRASGYRSKLEEAVAAELTELGVSFTYEEEKLRYLTRVRDGICGECKKTRTYQRHVYIPDFKVGSVYVEVKGRLTSSDRTKMLAVREEHPKKLFVFVFGANNKINKKSTTRYGDWADKHGFLWCIKGKIPRRWFK